MINLEPIAFFKDKDKHYPISDSFLENYMQKKGGYIKYADKTGYKVDPQEHEPNQKWHLYVSWFLNKLDKKEEIKNTIEGVVCYIDKQIERNSDISFTIKVFYCPELILWMAEAAGVDDKIVEEAVNYAKERIDEIRKASPNKAYSRNAVIYMNAKFKEKYKKTLLDMVKEKIEERQKN